MSRFLPLFSLLILCACGDTIAHTPSLTPEPVVRLAEPSDKMLFEKIDAYLKTQNGPKNAQYDYARLDMNADGTRDALVLFKLPHSYWCGWGGCTMAVFEARNNGFILRSEITNVRGPIKVAETRTQNWNDILLRVTGVDMPDRNVVLRFDRGAYPSNPVAAQEYAYDFKQVNGYRLFP